MRTHQAIRMNERKTAKETPPELALLVVE